MSLLHKVRHQRLRNWIILAVALLAAIAFISPEQLWFPSLPFSATTLIGHCFLTPARGAI